ncbi:hypothetical protein ACFVU2_19810 [Leifsonia sp. NPDC058194]|uniref:hypothetical protein n=1 Tax=Leifsonia sp. NPDC058194 TaxID=3346374 RepID=UPI0036DB44B9
MTEENELPLAADDGTRWCSTCKLEVPIASYCTNCGKDLGAFRGYTSGRTHRDPSPNIDNATGRRVRSGFPVPGCTWAPRPEYDNHDPILAAFRRDHETRLEWWTAEHHIETWLGPLGLAAESGEYPTYSTIWEIKQAATPDQIDHCCRVLTRLEALSHS